MSASIALPLPAPPSAAGAAVSAAATPAVTASVVDGAAAALASLAGGAPLSGTVVPSPATGIVVLFTALGSVSLATELPLAAGATMTLQAQAANPGAAVILAVNGSAPVAPPAAPATAPAAPPLAAPVLVALGTTVAATVVAAPPLAAPPPTPLAAGAPPVATSPGAVPAPVIAGAPPAVAPADAPGAAVPVALPAPPRGLPPGTNLAMRVLAVQAAWLPAAPRPAPALTGTIRRAATPGAVPVVDTAAGPVQLRGAPPLPAGTRVALRLLPDAPAGAELTILPEPAPQGAAPAAAAPEPAPPEPTSPESTPLESTPDSPRAAPPRAPAATTASAAAPSAQSAAPAPAAAQPTAAAKAPPPAAAEPEAAPVTPPATQPGAAAAAIVSAAAAAPPAADPSVMPPPPEAAAAPLRVVLAADGPPGRAPARPGETPAERSAGLIVTGTVLPDQSGGRAPLLVETPLGVLALSPRLAVPAGSLLLLLMAPDAAAPPLGLEDRPAPPGRGWSGLAGALPALEHAAPALAAQLRADFSPQAGGDRLAAGFLFLIDALRSPAGPPWPGELVAKALAAAGRDDDGSGVADDLGEARRIAAAPATGNWQVFLLPLFEGPQLRPLRLYLKRHDKSKRGTAEDSARFVLEFELSRFGALQLDGFVRPARFDLLLRTKAPLGAALEGMVERIFRDRVAAAGLGGTIDFSTVARFDIAPLDGLREHVGIAV